MQKVIKRIIVSIVIVLRLFLNPLFRRRFCTIGPIVGPNQPSDIQKLSL